MENDRNNDFSGIDRLMFNLYFIDMNKYCITESQLDSIIYNCLAIKYFEGRITEDNKEFWKIDTESLKKTYYEDPVRFQEYIDAYA